MEQVKIGWASRDISTTKPVNIPGQFHMRISKGVMDPVTVNALVLDSGEDQAIFLSCDIVVLRNGLQDLVREKLAQCAPEIPAMKILMNATHTHNGPSLERGKRPFDYGMEVASSDENREFVAEMCMQARPVPMRMAMATRWSRTAAGCAISTTFPSGPARW